MYCDIIIIGGGISGIYTMYNLKKKYPNLKVCLLESNSRFGGRIYTYREVIDGKEYYMDLGAGRLGFHHELILKLISELNINNNIIPIPNTKTYIETNNTNSRDRTNLRNKLMNKLYSLLNSNKIKNLPKKITQKLYLNQLLCKFLPKSEIKLIENTFEYISDLYYFNSFDVINYFKNDYNDKSKFFTLKNGLDTLIYGMIAKIKSKNYTLHTNSHVNEIQYNNEENLYNVIYKNNHNIKTIKCKHVVSALPRKDLIKFNILKPFKNIIDTVNDINLTRIFEVYETSKNDVWFKNIKKTVTNNKVKFVIPINSQSGLIMSAYNDTQNSKYWLNIHKKGDSFLKQILNKNLNLIFSAYNIKVPNSKWIKLHYWDMGVAAWKKNVDSDLISKQVINLLPNFYICGENYSQYQAWCEGALITSQEVLKKLYCDLDDKSKTRKLKTRKLKTRQLKTRQLKTRKSIRK